MTNDVPNYPSSPPPFVADHEERLKLLEKWLRTEIDKRARVQTRLDKHIRKSTSERTPQAYRQPGFPGAKPTKHEIYSLKFEIDSTRRTLLTLSFRETETRRFGSEENKWSVILAANSPLRRWRFAGGNKNAWKGIREVARGFQNPEELSLWELAGDLHGLRFYLDERI